MNIKIEDLKKNPNNPRIIKDEGFKKLKESLQSSKGKEHFDARPCIVSTRTGENIIIAGNTRFQAAKELGWKEVPTVIMEGLTEEQEQEIIIRDNVSNGEWDWNALINEWDTEKLEEWGVTLPQKLQQEEVKDDNYEVPEVSKTDIVLGDVFEIGGHRLLCGDSTKVDDVLRLMNGETGDMVLTDPPYNVNYEGGTGLKIQNDNMDDSSFYNFLYDFYTAVNSSVKKGGAWYVWHADSEGANFRKAMKDAGILLKQCLIWVKNSLVLGRQDYQWKHEPVLVGYNENEPDHEPLLYGWTEGASHSFYNDRKQTTVIEFPKPNRNREHPTMKPVELMGKLINNSSKEGEIVIDAFLGSGSTMVAAHQLNRKCYGIEFDPKYCEVIIDRMRKLDESMVIKKNGVVI